MKACAKTDLLSQNVDKMCVRMKLSALVRCYRCRGKKGNEVVSDEDVDAGSRGSALH